MNFFLVGVLLCIANSIGAIELPTTWSWISSNILVDVKPDSSHAAQSVKNPSIVFYESRYHVYASFHMPSGMSLLYFNFTDFDQANNAPRYYMDRTPGFG